MRIEAAIPVQPVVLVGGRSRRFGRDKLREPWPTGQDRTWVVDHPVGALRAVFGGQAAIWMAGEADAAVLQRGDVHVPDEVSGLGPMGGIAAALRRSGGDVLVLAGDMPWVSAAWVHMLLSRAAQSPGRSVVGRAQSWEPCFGVYRSAARVWFDDALARGELAMHSLIVRMGCEAMDVPPEIVRSVNRPEDVVG